MNLLQDVLIRKLQPQICNKVNIERHSYWSQKFFLLFLHIIPEEFQFHQGVSGAVISCLICHAEYPVSF